MGKRMIGRKSKEQEFRPERTRRQASTRQTKQGKSIPCRRKLLTDEIHTLLRGDASSGITEKAGEPDLFPVCCDITQIYSETHSYPTLGGCQVIIKPRGKILYELI